MFQSKNESINNHNEHIALSKLIRISGVIDLTALSKSYIYQLVKAGKFPKPINLVAGGTSVAWIEHEVLTYIDSRIEERDQKEAC